MNWQESIIYMIGVALMMRYLIMNQSEDPRDRVPNWRIEALTVVRMYVHTLPEVVGQPLLQHDQTTDHVRGSSVGI